MRGNGASLGKIKKCFRLGLKTHLRPTTMRTGSRIISIAIFSTAAGRVALNTAFWILGWVQAAMISCVCGRNSASRRRSASSSIRWRTLDKDTSPDTAKLFATTYFFKSRVPVCNDTTSRRGVLMMMSAQLKELNGRRTKTVNLPALSLIFLSARVAAVALLNNMIRHFRP